MPPRALPWREVFLSGARQTSGSLQQHSNSKAIGYGPISVRPGFGRILGDGFANTNRGHTSATWSCYRDAFRPPDGLPPVRPDSDH